MKRKKILILTTILALITFVILISLEKKLVNANPNIKVIVATKDIKQGEMLKKDYFQQEERSVITVTSDMIKSFDEIDNKYATENIYKEDTLNKKRIADKNDSSKMFLKPNEREFSIPLNKLDGDAFAGTLRLGDIVDIAHTEIASQLNPEPKTEITGKEVRILGAVDAQGKLLEPGDKNVIAASVMFAGTEEDFIKTTNDIHTGSFKIAKCPILPKK